ncbi:hypothetical protein HanIR_Chr07g0335031 [Helianthus annuus]|nr:hypothetical protein HanIR_Chr07g0335031 [Helianthus annuus]
MKCGIGVEVARYDVVLRLRALVRTLHGLCGLDVGNSKLHNDWSKILAFVCSSG